MTFVVSATDADSHRTTWHTIDWKRVNRGVRRLQTRIVKAVKAGQWRLVKNLQRLLAHSFYGRCLAVRRVVENQGKKTPGVDGMIWDTPKQKMHAVNTLQQAGYRAQPLRRIYIPKANGKKRQLGIPVMQDRAQQALHKLVLEPVAECLADGHSYGFRPQRSAHDAIEQVFLVLSRKVSPQWVLEADIKACFDEISSEWLLRHIPIDKTTLKQWLKAGYIEKQVFYPTEKGTPQGGIISPILANMCLDGLEKAVWGTPAEKRRYQVNVVRYADDFIVTSRSQDWLLSVAKPRIMAFLAERGLRLSPEKTQLTHVTQGFDFLGWTVRKYPNGKLLIKPSRESVQSLLAKTKAIFHGYRQASTENVIYRLNPLIRGWAYYHRSQVAKETFTYIDHHIFWQCWKWATRRHPKKPKKWIKARYFISKNGDNWLFTGANEDGKQRSVFKASQIPIKRHRKIRFDANPYDPDWDDYFEERQYKQWLDSTKGCGRLRRIWIRQKGICPVCGQTLNDKTYIQSHRLVPASRGGNDSPTNLILVHPNCKQQARHLAALGHDTLQPASQEA